jgi:predicted glutamine amidotransferase
MSNALALYTSNPNLLRCELHRLKDQVLRFEPQTSGTSVVGMGSYEQDEVLLQEYSAAQARAPLSELWRGGASDVVLFHATEVPVGAQLEQYAQPFRFRRWMFCHLGGIPEYSKFRLKLLSALPEMLQRQFSAESESQGAFALFLKNARDLGRVDDPELPAAVVAEALRRTTRQWHAYAVEAGAVRTSGIGLFVTNGPVLAVSRFGPLSLLYSLLEGAGHCELCGISPQTSEVHPLLTAHRKQRSVGVASQVAKGATGWLQMPEDSVLTVDKTLRVEHVKI